MPYINGAVIAVPTKNKQAYLHHSKEMAAIFRKHGATQVIEAWGDDVPDGEVTSFPMAVKCKPDETVVLSWIWWPSKAVHDTGMAKSMEDMQSMTTEMPFDGKRMIFASFDVVSEE